MKKLFAIVTITMTIGTTIFTSCSKGDDGAPGPQGTAGINGTNGIDGTNGTNGTNGINGQDGNANVTVINFGSKTFSSSADYALPMLSKGMIDSSLILVYYNPSSESATAWYAVPGLGSSGTYETRYILTQISSASTLRIFLNKPDGSGSYTGNVTFTKLKVIVAPGSTFINGKSTQPPVDYNDYYAVCKFYNIQS